MVTRSIFVDLEQVEQRGYRRADDFFRLHKIAALVGNPPDATVRVVAGRIAQRMLHVSDKRIVPVADIERPVETELQIDRTEVGIRRGDEWFDFRRRETGTLVSHLVLQYSLKTDAVVQQVVSLRLVGKMTVRDDHRSTTGTDTSRKDRFHAPVFVGIFDVAGKGGRKVIGPIRGVRHKTLSPAIKHVTPGIGERVRHKHVEFLASRFVAKHACIGTSHRTVRCLDL